MEHTTVKRCSQYLKSMDDRMQFPFPDKNILMQDGARAHTAKASIAKIKNGITSVWEDRPGNSPDLNVIKNVWSVMQESVFEPPRPRNREQLIARVQEKWNSLPGDYLTKLVDSFPQRILDVLSANGGVTKN